MGRSRKYLNSTNGLDCLKEKLINNYGLSTKQAEQAVTSNNTRRILEILATEEGLLEKVVLDGLQEREENLSKQQKIIEQDYHDINEAFYKLSNEQRVHQEQLDRLKDIDNREKYLNELESQILSVETPEAKDKLRLYEIFKRDTEIETSQNNTVYIAGRAAILSGVPVWGGNPDEQDESGKKRRY